VKTDKTPVAPGAWFVGERRWWPASAETLAAMRRMAEKRSQRSREDLT
jgi:hypothetical protein